MVYDVKKEKERLDQLHKNRVFYENKIHKMRLEEERILQKISLTFLGMAKHNIKKLRKRLVGVRTNIETESENLLQVNTNIKNLLLNAKKYK